MDFISEKSVVAILSDTIIKSGVSLYNSVKYIYSIAEEDFYNCNIKDALKVTLNNITDTDCLRELGLRINNYKCVEMNNDEYNKILPLMVYSFAVRIPTLKNVKVFEQTMTDAQLKMVYDTVISKGAENYYDTIPDTYDQIKMLVKKGKNIPPYTSDWYKVFIYNHVPSLSEIKNKNFFLLGFVDVLFAMFYSCLEEELAQIIRNNCVSQ